MQATRLSIVTLALAASLGSVGDALPASGSFAAPTVHPGAAVSVSDNTCEAGVMLRHHHKVYVTVPASCFGTDDGGATDGCTEAQIPYSSPVTIAGAKHPGRLVYSSYTAMQLRGTHSSDACSSNDLALVRVNAHDVRRVTPTIPGIGRPKSIAKAAPADGSTLRTYLNGSAQSATAGQTSDGGWHHAVTFSGMVDQSDIGAPLVNPAGQVVGLASVLPKVGGVGSSQAADFSREMHFLHKIHGFHHVHLMHARVH